MHGQNESEHWLSEHDGQVLDVQEVFTTIQGEGPMAGRPATFVRLAGCHLRCHFCDTDFISKRHEVTLPALVGQVSKDYPLVVLTGGEPMRQNIVPLCERLIQQGHQVQIETSGTLWVPAYYEDRFLRLGEALSIVVSPKTYAVHRHLRPLITAWKYLVAHDAVFDGDGLPTNSTQHRGRQSKPARPDTDAPIYLQPIDYGPQDPDKNREAIQRAVYACMIHNHILSLQLHKIVGLP